MAKQITKEARQALQFVKTAYEENNTETISKIEALAGVPIALEGDLLEAYNKLGDTPIETPELYINKKDFDDEQDFIFTLADRVTKLTEIKDTDYSIEEFSSFILKAYKKVNDFTYSNGDVKSTPRTENAKPPVFSDLRRIRNITEDKNKRLQALGEYDPTIGDASEYIEAINIITSESDKKLLSLAYKITGVKAKGLTDWEKELLVTNIVTYASNSLSSGFGRSL